MDPVTWLEDNLPRMDGKKRKVVEFIFLWQKYNYTYNLRHPSRRDKEGALFLANCPQAQKKYTNNLKQIFMHGDGAEWVGFKNIHSVHCPDGCRDRLWKDVPNQCEVKYDHAKDSLEDFLKVVYQIQTKQTMHS